MDRNKIKLPQIDTSDDNTNSNVDREIKLIQQDSQIETILNEQTNPQINSCDKTLNELFGHAIKKIKKPYSYLFSKRRWIKII